MFPKNARCVVLVWLCVLAQSQPLLATHQPEALCADRGALERVYHNHRLGTKPPFEQVLPPAAIEALVKLDLKKEAVLKRVYGVAITETQVADEVKRIDGTTRAPEILADLKRALGNDPSRFARAAARPLVVDRELRARFSSQAEFQAPRRQAAQQICEQLLSAKAHGTGVKQLVALLKQQKDGLVSEVTWQLSPAPRNDEELSPPSAAMPRPATEVKTRGGVYAIEATAQLAQVLSSPPASERDPKCYFEDLPDELQAALGSQLKAPGEVSTIMEREGGFVLFLAKERTAQILSVASLSVPKQSYEEWLAAQPD